ncbi:hypothetical protein SAMN05216389_10670 [Oceanobacillus limi]|uniref:Uncharacterized protein n=1 Tax=Oceanobacillus limi TaxID=930131 RepID=A0A1I0C776_9BACI|nr:hypothetical protein [Oceanobacillus limi]SET15303.1 hypothetical protein SAMN05216389_10670 [Oceanobacillus limi]
MLRIRGVSIKSNKQLILHNCSCDISSQSIIVAQNDINTKILSLSLAGLQPVVEGEVFIDENSLAVEQKKSKDIFFVITENFHKLWKNYRLKDIYKVIKSKKQSTQLCKKYNISLEDTINSLSKFQQLVYLISIGESLNRTIYIFDQPTKHLDYEELELFQKFLKEDFKNMNYIIFTNRFGELSSGQSVYQIESKKLIVKS